MGANEAFETHTDRMLELEAECATRFPDRTVPAAMRTREGSRQLDGRSLDGASMDGQP